MKPLVAAILLVVATSAYAADDVWTCGSSLASMHEAVS